MANHEVALFSFVAVHCGVYNLQVFDFQSRLGRKQRRLDLLRNRKIARQSSLVVVHRHERLDVLHDAFLRDHLGSELWADSHDRSEKLAEDRSFKDNFRQRKDVP